MEPVISDYNKGLNPLSVIQLSLDISFGGQKFASFKENTVLLAFSLSILFSHFSLKNENIFLEFNSERKYLNSFSMSHDNFFLIHIPLSLILSPLPHTFIQHCWNFYKHLFTLIVCVTNFNPHRNFFPHSGAFSQACKKTRVGI